MLYRIFTEDRDNNSEQKIVELIGSYGFPSFTLFHADGYWQGKRERTLVIEIDTESDVHVQSRIRSLAASIRIVNKQDAVMVQEIAATSTLSTASHHAL